MKSITFAIAAQAGVIATSTFASVLLHDEFHGPTLSSIWRQGSWRLGRTYLGAPLSFSNEGSTTFLSLPLHSYHPSYPGTYLFGAEIYSHENFARNEGLLAEARVRLRTEARGMVASFFGYRYLSNVADELDFEFLSNYPSNTLLLTQWNDWDYTGQNGSRYHNNINHHSVLVTNDAINRSTWTVLRFYWLPGETVWEANGVELYRSSFAQPDAPMPIRANFWAPDGTWPDAYDYNLRPVSSLAQNSTFWYDIDYITVVQLPEPVLAMTVIVGGSLFIRRNRRG